MDVYSNEIFIQTLINPEIVCGIASEENHNFKTIQDNDNSNNNNNNNNNNNKYVVLMDLLDGSSNFDVDGFFRIMEILLTSLHE